MHMLTAMYFSRASSSTSGRKLVAPHPHPDCPFICLTMSSSFFIYHKINIQCIHSVKRTHTLPFILYYKIGFCRASIFVLSLQPQVESLDGFSILHTCYLWE